METLRSHPVLGEDASTIMIRRRYDHEGSRYDQQGRSTSRKIADLAGSMLCLFHLFRVILEQFLPRHQDRLWLTDTLAEAAAHHAQKRLCHPDLSILITLKHFPRA
jgi:hypothetical protein